MLVRLTLLLNVVAIAVVLAVIFRVDLPAADDLARLADDALATLQGWAQAIRPWIEAAVARLQDWAKAALEWLGMQLMVLWDWVLTQV